MVRSDDQAAKSLGASRPYGNIAAFSRNRKNNILILKKYLSVLIEIFKPPLKQSE
jgi:hypothetical protein